MNATQILPAPKRANYRNDTLASYRERLSDTTLAKFTNRIKRLLEALDTEDPATPVRQFIAERGTEKFFSGMVGTCYVNFTFDEKGGTI